MEDIIKLISVDEKIFLEKEPSRVINNASIARNEVFSFQIAIRNNAKFMETRKIKAKADFPCELSIREVRNIPVGLAVYDEPKRDDYFLSTCSGVYPDALCSSDGKVLCAPKKWVSVLIGVKPKKEVTAGEYLIEVYVEKETNCTNENSKAVLNLKIYDFVLPECKLIVTNWLHYDCLCEAYGVKPFSERFYKILREHFKSQILHGCNMIYIPLFTPPLDTKVGIYRKTVQTVKIRANGENFFFDFGELKKLISIAKKCGYKYFEFSHLFSQWGLKHPPKIVCERCGKEELLFGWNDDSLSSGYLSFLKEFFIGFNKIVEQIGIKDNSFLHISDEPKESDFERYKTISEFIEKNTDLHIIEAISDPRLCKQRNVDLPCISLDSYDKFESVEDKIIYTCCEEYDRNLTNRFICMPACRTRVFGVQAYLMRIKGYLHWGFNFYHSELSVRNINPYEITDGCGGFPSGDAFIVYPDKKTGKVVDSIRHEIFYEGIQDYRALSFYESVFGRNKTEKLIADFGVSGFETYPHDDEWLNKLREKIYTEVEQ